MPKVIARIPLSYLNVRYAKGDVIKMKDSHARRAISARLVDAAPEPPPTKASGQTYATREMEAARPNYHARTVAQLKAELDRRGIKYQSRSTKSALLKLAKG